MCVFLKKKKKKKHGNRCNCIRVSGSPHQGRGSLGHAPMPDSIMTKAGVGRESVNVCISNEKEKEKKKRKKRQVGLIAITNSIATMLEFLVA